MAKLMRHMLSAGGAGNIPDPSTGNVGDKSPFNALANALLNPQTSTADAGQNGTVNQQQQVQQAPSSNSLNIWRIFHAIVMLALTVYFAWYVTPFTGTLSQREEHHRKQFLHGDTNDASNESYHYDPSLRDAERRFFISFATLESALLTGRYLVEKFRPGSQLDSRSGALWTISGVLPQPLSGWLETALRYKAIFDALLSDLLTVIFVLGGVAWVRG